MAVERANSQRERKKSILFRACVSELRGCVGAFQVAVFQPANIHYATAAADKHSAAASSPAHVDLSLLVEPGNVKPHLPSKRKDGRNSPK